MGPLPEQPCCGWLLGKGFILCIGSTNYARSFCIAVLDLWSKSWGKEWRMWNPPSICHASLSGTGACKVFLIIHPWALPVETQLSSATEVYAVQRQESMREVLWWTSCLQRKKVSQEHKVWGAVDCGSRELVEFRILRRGTMAKRSIITPVSRRAEFGLFI